MRSRPDEFQISLTDNDETLLKEARAFSVAVLLEKEDPTDSNTAIKLAEKVEKATRFLVDY